MDQKFYKKRSILIEDIIPRFIRNEYPQFVEFIKVYYTQQDIVGEGYEFIANSIDYLDIDKTTLEYLENFSGTYLSSFPKNIKPEINKRTLIKNIKQFYESLGSEKSIKFLFRILFNEDIELYYPTTEILRVSDGKWQDDFIIKISNNREDDLILGLVGTEILGQTSGARGLIERIELYTASNGFKVAECSISRITPVNDISEFQVDEIVAGITLDGKTIIESHVYSIISDMSLDINDLYNLPGDLIRISSDIGVDGYVSVGNVESGSVDSVSVIVPGTGYSVDDIIEFISNSGRAAKAIISAIDGSGGITSIEMISSGHSYSEMPSYTISSAGSGARLYPVSSKIGKIKSFDITNFGVNYTGSEQPGFPYDFPIQFTFIPTTTEFQRVAFIYDDSWNGFNYRVNETIEGSVSGATGTIKRISTSTGIIAFELTSETEFTENESITGQTSGAEGYRIHALFTTSGNIVPGPIGNLKGYFKNTDGFISGDRYIQDSYYYQDFSYAITTLQEKDDWIVPLKDLTHPAGTIVFGFSESSKFVTSYSFGGFSSMRLDEFEFYKFKWGYHLDDTLAWTGYGDTQLSTYTDYLIDRLTVIDGEEYPGSSFDDINTIGMTNICFGSNIRYSYPDIDQQLLIDEINSLLIDTTNNLLL